MYEADGWENRQCVICKTKGLKVFNVHHVFGHPDHSRLALMCMGCHDAVSKLASRKRMDVGAIRLVSDYAIMQKLGRQVCDVRVVKVVASGDEQPHTEVRISELVD